MRTLARTATLPAPILRSVTLTVACAALTGAAPLRAQVEEGPQRKPRARPLAPAIGVRVGAPLRHAFYAGVVWVDRSSADTYEGTSLVAEVGQGGAQVGVGRSGFGGPAAAYRLQGLVLHTWWRPTRAEPDETYLGAEARLSVLLVGVGVAGYRRVRGGSRGSGWLGTATLVVGL